MTAVPTEADLDYSHRPTRQAQTIRVSLREIREECSRALMATGSSSGEAAAAERAALFTEVHFHSGVGVVVAEAGRAGAPEGPVRRDVLEGGKLQVLQDRSGRGLLHLAPLALGLVTALAVPPLVHLPRLDWEPVLAGVLATAPARGRAALVALHASNAGKLDAGVLVTPGGEVTIYTEQTLDEFSTFNPALIQRITSLEPGIVIGAEYAGFTLPPTIPLYSRERLEEQHRASLDHGVRVNMRVWADLYRLSARYLVPE